MSTLGFWTRPIRLSCILAALGAVFEVSCRAESVEDFIDPSAVPRLFPGFSADRATIIEIKRRLPKDIIKAQDLHVEQQFEVIKFHRDGDAWALATEGGFRGLKLATDRIEGDVLDHLVELRFDKDKLVSEESVDEEFRRSNGLTVETGITIRCFGSPQGANIPPPELAHVILGKRNGTKSVDGYYVCDPSKPRKVIVYEPHNQDWTVSLTPTDWADKTQ